MYYFLAFCFMIMYYTLAVAGVAFIISRFFTNKKAAFTKVCEYGMIGSLVGVLLQLAFTFSHPSVNWIWIAITVTAAGMIAGSIKAKK